VRHCSLYSRSPFSYDVPLETVCFFNIFTPPTSQIGLKSEFLDRPVQILCGESRASCHEPPKLPSLKSYFKKFTKYFNATYFRLLGAAKERWPIVRFWEKNLSEVIGLAIIQ
jgi:hypothetical protein